MANANVLSFSSMLAFEGWEKSGWRRWRDLAKGQAWVITRRLLIRRQERPAPCSPNTRHGPSLLLG